MYNSVQYSQHHKTLVQHHSQFPKTCTFHHLLLWPSHLLADTDMEIVSSIHCCLKFWNRTKSLPRVSLVLLSLSSVVCCFSLGLPYNPNMFPYTLTYLFIPDHHTVSHLPQHWLPAWMSFMCCCYDVGLQRQEQASEIQGKWANISHGTKLLMSMHCGGTFHPKLVFSPKLNCRNCNFTWILV